MTSPEKIVSLASIEQLNLSQWLPQDSTPPAMPITFDQGQQAFALTMESAVAMPIEQPELVVFENMPLTTLVALLNSCQLTLHRLNKINQRNGLTSYRFSVQVSDLKQARDKLAKFTASAHLDAALVLNAPILAKPGLLVMDMDSTTIKIECIDEIAALAGVGDEVAAVTELAMQGQLDFSESLYQRVAKLRHAPEAILAQVAQDIPLMEGLETLVKALKNHGWRVAIASGGFTYFADHLKQMLALDAAAANLLEIKNQKLTGKVLGGVIDAKAKAKCLKQWQLDYSIKSTQTVAMGDGANDLVMMAAAQLGVAFHAKPLVLAQADSCITHSGLDTLLHWLK
ncbi:phosphoserine phosphatase [Colwellia chukchiensis]|uniref:Phosphoserine phosphatase n=1 Tax=Colwellia chukchiensis TaxID=641665 RepID=A0A1H7G5K2_9GAMM|nr:phosphoserine phosphatase SerB [Colwellia chukchiensis]SEK33354.1 phosphoserine phosphatase [Colwellia chukchiensis]